MADNIKIHGAKNAALPILAATLLDKKIYYIKNIYMIDDILTQINILKQFNINIQKTTEYLIIDTTNIIIPNKILYNHNTRGSYYFIGSTIHYDSNLEFILSNGCEIDINSRKFNFHIELIKLAGKDVIISNNNVKIFGNFKDEDINYTFKIPSVGATINGLFIFSKTKNIVTFYNYAKDPYIIDVIEFLKSTGIYIIYDDEKIIINGKKIIITENIIYHNIIPDPIEIITYIIFSVINLNNNSISPYTIGPINIEHLGDIFNLFNKIGIFLIESIDKKYYFIKKNILSSFDIETGYFPKIYTDSQPFLLLLALHINNKSTIKENIWNNRFEYVKEINKFGYNIEIINDKIIIDPAKFSVINYNNIINCTDLRGGMAIQLFLKKYDMKNILTNIRYVKRGYYNYKKNINKILNSNINIETDYSCNKLSNINIGGICKYYSKFNKVSELKKIICFSHKININYKIIGEGNNIYFSNHINLLILKNNIKKYINYKNNIISCSSSILLMDFVSYCGNKKIDISSLSGIPSTLGGALYCNSGAYGLEIKDIIDSCSVLKNNKIILLKKNEMELGYRTSIFKKNKNNDFIIKINFKLEKSKIYPTIIINRIQNILDIRNKKFIYNNTLGSIFKNIIKEDDKYYCWKLIDSLGIRGNIIKNIKLSEINPNIFININNASFEDIEFLINYIKNEINDKHNLIMEEEIECIK